MADFLITAEGSFNKEHILYIQPSIDISIVVLVGGHSVIVNEKHADLKMRLNSTTTNSYQRHTQVELPHYQNPNYQVIPCTIPQVPYYPKNPFEVTCSGITVDQSCPPTFAAYEGGL
jgi:hypothetical protein